ncbi:MAG: hypothetical protein AB7T49_14230 [Oligoflexales bacterium]
MKFWFAGMVLLLSSANIFGKTLTKESRGHAQKLKDEDNRDPATEEKVDQRKMPKEICFQFNIKLVPSDGGEERLEKGPEVCEDVSQLFQRKDVKCVTNTSPPCDAATNGKIHFTSPGYEFTTTGRSAYMIRPYPLPEALERTYHLGSVQLWLFTNWEYRLSNILAAYKENHGLDIESIVLPGNIDSSVSMRINWINDEPMAEAYFPSAYAVGFDSNNKEYDVIIEPVFSKISFQE